jgi:hypothetical protein
MPIIIPAHPHLSNEATVPSYRRTHRLQETLLRPREAVLGSLEPAGEELCTASRLLDPNEPWNRDIEHQKAIALVRVSD